MSNCIIYYGKHSLRESIIANALAEQFSYCVCEHVYIKYSVCVCAVVYRVGPLEFSILFQFHARISGEGVKFWPLIKVPNYTDAKG